MSGFVWHPGKSRASDGAYLPGSGIADGTGNGMAAFTDYENHDAVGLAALAARGETTPEALLEAAPARPWFDRKPAMVRGTG